MSKSKSTPTVKPIDPVDWTGVRVQRVEHDPAAQIFAQGDPATSVMYVEKGAVRLSVLSHAGKEAVVAVLDAGHFFGEGCLAGQMHRMATATAMAPSTILAVEKPEDAVAASSTRPGRNIVGPCRPIPGRTVRTVRRPKCETRKRWSRHPAGAGVASLSLNLPLGSL
jgi:hypothetical protein